MTPRTRGAGKAPGAGIWKTASDASRQAWIEHRRILVDELVQHPDVWEYIADQAAEVAAAFPVGSGEWSTFLWLAKASAEAAAVLERAQTAGEQAAS